ncbi:MAG: hypothetical protein A2017_19790 [Lentisphaerae bacterium GWF2_44_16]|nr:MAG: hypothetical protein A2017_19790 [Lentisphaerae bacterium GWF2_44_16]
MKKFFSLLIAFAAFCAMGQHKEGCYIKKKDGSTISANSITSNAAGDLTYEMGAVKVKSIIKKKDYIFAWIPEPSVLKTADAAMKKKDYDAASKAYLKASEDYKYLGWYVYSIDMYGKTLFELGKKDEAIKALSVLNGYDVKDDKEETPLMEAYRTLASAYIDTAKYKEAELVLKELEKAKNEDMAAYASIAGGDIAMKQGNKKDAALMYLQAVLLFPATNKERPLALCKAANALKEINHPQAAKYADMLRKEYSSSPYVKELK